jgi:hypothetical protein
VVGRGVSELPAGASLLGTDTNCAPSEAADMPARTPRGKTAGEGLAGRPRREEQCGLACPTCDGQHFRAIYTGASPGGRIVRHRDRRQCKERSSAYERTAS